MKFYGHVHFFKGGLVGALQQNEVMRRMAEGKVIIITEEQLSKFFADDKETEYGGNHVYHLHNLKELFQFRKIMKNYKRGLAYTDDIDWWVDRERGIKESEESAWESEKTQSISDG